VAESQSGKRGDDEEKSGVAEARWARECRKKSAAVRVTARGEARGELEKKRVSEQEKRVPE